MFARMQVCACKCRCLNAFSYVCLCRMHVYFCVRAPVDDWLWCYLLLSCDQHLKVSSFCASLRSVSPFISYSLFPSLSPSPGTVIKGYSHNYWIPHNKSCVRYNFLQCNKCKINLHMWWYRRPFWLSKPTNKYLFGTIFSLILKTKQCLFAAPFVLHMFTAQVVITRAKVLYFSSQIDLL